MQEKLKKANEDFKEGMMKLIRNLGDQITIAISAKLGHALLPSNETGNFCINIWYRNCNNYGYSEPYYQLPKI